MNLVFAKERLAFPKNEKYSKPVVKFLIYGGFYDTI